MQAITLEDGTVRVRADYPRPTLGPGEARVRITRAGICGTDIEMTRGYRPFSGVLGHEFTGVVEEAECAAWVGRRVVGEINLGCGVCATCQRLGRVHCERRTVLGILARDGVFAEYCAVPEVNLHAVPDGVSDDQAVFTEPLAAACELVECTHVRPSARVAVIGAGRLGLLCAQVLALTGCDLVVLARAGRGAELLRAWGIPVLDAEAGAPGLARACDVVVDCTGRVEGFAPAAALVRPRGTLALKSTYHGAGPLNLSDVVVDELTVQGSRCGPFDAALRLLATGHVQVTPLITARYPLQAGLEALAHAGRRGALKIVLEPGA